MEMQNLKILLFQLRRALWRSLLLQLKHKVQREAVHEVEMAVGGMRADWASSLPRNERQARYIKSKAKESYKTDPVSALLHMQLEEETPFILCVTVDRNSPIIVLFSEEQIKDKTKFWCNEEGPNSHDI